MQQRFVFAIITAFSLLFLSFSRPEIHQYSLIGIFLFINVLNDFFVRLGSEVPIKQVILLIALLQWVVAPILSYHYYTTSFFYSMSVTEDVYMSYLIPSIILFLIGLLAPIGSLKNEKLNRRFFIKSINNVVLVRRGRFLFWTGVAALLAQPFVPKVIGFFLFLTSNLTVIGAFYLFTANVRFRLIYLLIAFAPILYGAILSSIFHDMFLWGAFFFILYSLVIKVSFFRKLLFFSISFSILILVQLVKNDYREEISINKVSGIDVFTEIANEKIEGEIEEGFGQNTVDRLNQGWIISKIMYRVPSYEPFAKGETIENGLIAAFLPRFLLPGKVTSGGYYFERFTGILLRGASMNLGLVGEAYANYGIIGGSFFMLIFGLFINVSLALIYAQSKKFPEIILWIPFLFLYMVKAEDDFTTMINYFTKSFYVMLLIFWIMKHAFPFRKPQKSMVH